MKTKDLLDRLTIKRVENEDEANTSTTRGEISFALVVKNKPYDEAVDEIRRKFWDYFFEELGPYDENRSDKNNGGTESDVQDAVPVVQHPGE